MTQPLGTTVGGLPPNQDVQVRLTSVDSRGVRWESTAKFRTSAQGTLDVNRAPSLGGSYSGVHPMGLFSTMLPTNRGEIVQRAYWWHGSTPMTFTLTVTKSGTTEAVHSFARCFLRPGVTHTDLDVRTNGFFGQFWRPVESSADRRPTIVIFGGSEGGLSTNFDAAQLASAGYPTLALAYFKEPGLPHSLLRIPLEYFAKALRWVDTQPDVDPRHVFGSSRGSEAALLLGVDYPGLVYGVIAGSPSSTVHAGYPETKRAAWTWKGQPVPYTEQVNSTRPTDVPAAVIPVQQIRGPVFLDCGDFDEIWHSCSFAHAIVARLKTRASSSQVVLAEYPNAGHFVADPIPYWPTYSPPYGTGYGNGKGRYPHSNDFARAQLWPRLLKFLRASAH